jgi:hypothetical protein
MRRIVAHRNHRSAVRSLAKGGGGDISSRCINTVPVKPALQQLAHDAREHAGFGARTPPTITCFALLRNCNTNQFGPWCSNCQCRARNTSGGIASNSPE